MKFVNTTIAGREVGLLLIRPEINAADGRSFEITYQLDTLIGLGRTTIEERSPKRSHPRLKVDCTLRPSGAAVDDWRKGIAALGNRALALPLWIDALPAPRWAERIHAPQVVINFDPATDEYEIYAADELPLAPPHLLLAPLYIGRWANRPKSKATTRGLREIALALEDDSPLAARIGVHAYGEGWAAVPDWSSPPTETSELDLELLRVSSHREAALDHINAAPRWLQEAEFAFTDRLAIRQALTHFVAMRGAWQSWSGLPSWMHVGEATTATPATQTARFASDELKLAFANGRSAKARIAFLQEIDTGTRSQALPAQAQLYRFACDLDADNPELWTNWDAPITTAAGTFQPFQIAHSEIIKSLKPQDVKADLSMAFQAGTLMGDWNLGRLYAPVRLSIWNVDPDAPGSPTTLFGGQVVAVVPEGNTLKISAKLFGGILEKEIGSWLYGRQCRTYLCSSLCGIDEAAVRSSATLAPANVSSDGLTLTLSGVTGWGGTSYAAGWFAHGLLRTGSGRSTIRVTIIDSAMSGTNLILKLRRRIYPDMIAIAGQSVQLVPGCGRQYETDCGSKFSNQDHFRGEPYMPAYLETVAIPTKKIGK